ncbi:probable chitinase 10 [Limulus polyphemus]|uniref:Probable chitinase 10 n=1 Tax=Limulus polyphemus TaxID=6850 RepID=A0ABM1BT85_LIMPO|nr:probable chitinase 10 [Limulus polyphemus]
MSVNQSSKVLQTTLVHVSNVLLSGDDKLKVVCYFTNWAWYRAVGGRFLPEDIDPTLCTHINYAFATLDSTSLTLKPFDSWADIENNFYERVVALKNRNPRLRVLLALGGWTDSAGDKYTRLTASATKRRNFIQQAVHFLQQHHFDGLDLDWEFPVCWQSSCGSGPTSDRSNFATFVRELREAFDQVQPTLLLTAAVSASKTIIDNAYDVPSLANNLDFINLMAYDYHGSWEKRTGHVAPLYQKLGDPLSANFSLTYWVQKGAPPHKLILGTPFYGRSFTLASSNMNGIGAPSNGGGKAGPLTKEIGILAYYEICDKMNNQAWRQVKDPSGGTGPYAYREDQWVGFDDPETLSQKAKLVREQGYGGVMMWTVDFDDFSGICCQKPFPLLRAVHYGLFGTGDPPETYKCEENLISREPPFGIIVPVAHQYPVLLRADQVPQ